MIDPLTDGTERLIAPARQRDCATGVFTHTQTLAAMEAAVRVVRPVRHRVWLRKRWLRKWKQDSSQNGSSAMLMHYPVGSPSNYPRLGNRRLVAIRRARTRSGGVRHRVGWAPTAMQAKLPASAQLVLLLGASAPRT